MKVLLILGAMLLSLMPAMAGNAANPGSISNVSAKPTRDQAVALVKEGVAFLKKNGREAFLKEVNMAKGSFHSGVPGRNPGLYLFAYDLKGICLAQGQTIAMVGQNRWDSKDPRTGKNYVQEFIAIAKGNKAGGWVDYHFTNPETKAMEPKSSFLVLADDMAIGCGIYL